MITVIYLIITFNYFNALISPGLRMKTQGASVGRIIT